MKVNSKGYIFPESEKKTEKDEIQETAWVSVFNCLTVVVCLLIAVSVVFSMFFKVVQVDGVSMAPTLNDNESLLVYTMNYTPEAGDIVVIGESCKIREAMVKRIIATQDQTVSVDYESGKVFVDGVELNENYVTSMTKPDENEIKYPYTVPSGCVFVMGDNRDESGDSRSKSIRAVDVKHIVGKVLDRS